MPKEMSTFLFFPHKSSLAAVMIPKEFCSYEVMGILATPSGLFCQDSSSSSSHLRSATSVYVDGL